MKTLKAEQPSIYKEKSILSSFPGTAYKQKMSYMNRAALPLNNRTSYHGIPVMYTLHLLLILIAPFAGFTRKYVKLNVGIDIKFDNSFIRKDLAMEFIPFEKTVLDHCTQLQKDKIIK